jgi:hypothetical protein
VRAPGVWSSAWTCPVHGAVVPLQPPHPPTTGWLRDVAARARVPVWLPWPLPEGWLVSGVAEAGTPKLGPVATVVACSGPHPAPDPGAGDGRAADLLLVAEQPGTGLGARLAGIDAVDPGDGVGVGPAHARLEADGHPAPMWHVPGAADRAAYVGESAGVWLWAVLWPAGAGVLLLERLSLVDLRTADPAVEPPCGAPTPLLGWPLP